MLRSEGSSDGGPARSRLPRTVIALGLVSLLTDLSSEMIYPLLPVFLASVLGASALSLGLIEGVAESTAALLKVISGAWSDRLRRRKPLVFAGYSLSGLARPLIGLARVWPFVLVMRFADRLGKGLRTTPRDALIADVTPAPLRGRAYGLHRAMDHAGAVLGPLVAAGLLSLAGVNLRLVFLLAGVPGIAVLLVLVFGVHEPAAAPVEAAAVQVGFRADWRRLGTGYRRLLQAVAVFTLGNSTDAFLLLRLTDLGLGPRLVAVLWSLHSLVRMAATYAGGRLSDRVGRRGMVGAGWAVYAAVYLAFGLVRSQIGIVVVFLAYGLYFGLTEPAEKAWVADLVPARLRGTAFGGYHGAVGLTALPASLLFGLLWQALGVEAAFLSGAGLAGVAFLLLLRVPPGRTSPGNSLKDPG